MTEGDPTDDALATIASILEPPAAQRGSEKRELNAGSVASEPFQVDGYSKIGPGSLEPLRLRWTVRRVDDGAFYVHETIGENSSPAVSGPMSADAAIAFVDDRQEAANRRFEQLKNEMSGHAAAEHPFSEHNSEF